MTRQEKYPETATFHFHNQNPKGRLTGDCTFRAISRATGKDYNAVVMEMAELMCKTGYGLTDIKGITSYMETIGWRKLPQPRKADGRKYTGNEYARICKRLGYTDVVCTIGGGHISCIIDGKINDTWDCGEWCVGSVWVNF